MRWLRWRRATRWIETEVIGRLSDEGVCGERLPPSAEWTIRARLVFWATPGCAPTPEPLEIVHRGSLEELHAMQRRWVPGCEVRVRVRLRSNGRDAELVRVARTA